MISCDTNILYYAVNSSCPESIKARSFLEENADNSDFAICELNLMELYVLLRNPKMNSKPASAEKAVGIVRKFRCNPSWRVIDYPGALMEAIWMEAARHALPYRAIFDIRLALTLLHHGVEEFATRNVKDFKTFPFRKIWDPMK